MTNISLRDRRHQKAVTDLAKLERQRDEALDRLMRITAAAKQLRRAIARYIKADMKPVAEKSQLPVEDYYAPFAAALATPEALAVATGDEGIPDFLRRQVERSADARDEVARRAILTEQAELKKAKTTGRIAKLKAKQAGELDAMPLTGKAALARIKDDM